MFLPPPKFAEAGYPEMADGFRQFLENRGKLLRKASGMSAREPSLSMAERHELAETWFAAREFDVAEAEFRRILEKAPHDADARMHLAVLQGQQGRYAAAEALLLQALETDPGNVDLWANLGNARFHRALRGTLPAPQRREWLELARQAYARGQKLDPHNSTCRAGLSGVRRSSP
jgi:tetratricopeptide (TPR) repeat protein